MGDATSARYFDEVGLEVVPLSYPLEQHGLQAVLYVEEEHGCRASWSTEISGCIQRGLSLAATEAALTRVSRCVHEGRKVTVPLTDHREKKDQ